MVGYTPEKESRALPLLMQKRLRRSRPLASTLAQSILRFQAGELSESLRSTRHQDLREPLSISMPNVSVLEFTRDESDRRIYERLCQEGNLDHDAAINGTRDIRMHIERHGGPVVWQVVRPLDWGNNPWQE